MIGRQQFGEHFHAPAHPFPVLAGIVHGEDFHPVLHLVLAGGQEFAFGRPLTPLRPVNLYHAEPTDGHRVHVLLVAQDGDGDFRLVARLFDVELHRRVVNGRVAGLRPALQVLHDVPVRVLQRRGQRYGDGLPVDRQRHHLGEVRRRRRVQPHELPVEIAPEKSLAIVTDPRPNQEFLVHRFASIICRCVVTPFTAPFGTGFDAARCLATSAGK